MKKNPSLAILPGVLLLASLLGELGASSQPRHRFAASGEIYWQKAGSNEPCGAYHVIPWGLEPKSRLIEIDSVQLTLSCFFLDNGG